MKLFYLLPLVTLMVGCATTLPPRYTVAEMPDVRVKRNNTAVTVRMASDLRAYNQPLIFNADGTVRPCVDFTYYAPLEVAIERALVDASDFNLTASTPLRVTVSDFCVDARGETPIAKVTLKTKEKACTKTAPLSDDYTVAELRGTLGMLLLTAYQEL